MIQLSEKELASIKSLLSEEQLLVKKYQMLAEHATHNGDKESAKMMMDISQKHQGHFNELFAKLS